MSQEVNPVDFANTPWGRWEVLLDTDYCKVKRIFVNPGHRLSHQTHQRRQEVWTIVQGTATVVLNDKETIHETGDTIFIPKGAPHRIGNTHDTPVIFIEVQRGDYFGEDDIIRLDDDYGRK